MAKIIYHGKRRALVAGRYMSDGETRIVGEKMARSLLGIPGITVEGIVVEAVEAEQPSAPVVEVAAVDQNEPVRVDKKRSTPKKSKNGSRKK